MPPTGLKSLSQLHLPTSPKAVQVPNVLYVAKIAVTPETVAVVSGCFRVEILSSCHGHGGCHWHFLTPLTCVIPRADSCTIICTVHQ